VIEHPMDFGTVRKKLARNAYRSFEQFEVRLLGFLVVYLGSGCDLLAIEELLFSSFYFCRERI
jgi:hypothetical protein